MHATASQLSSAEPAENLLNSWKEIACYLDRGVRTVQRWEAHFGLPVRRLRGKSRSAVIAMRSDLDQWLRTSTFTAHTIPPSGTSSLQKLHSSVAQPHRVNDLIMHSRKLRGDNAQAQKEFRGALNRLIENLQRMAQVQASSMGFTPPSLPVQGRRKVGDLHSSASIGCV